MRNHAQRVRSIPPTIFSEMSALAVRTGAINLGQGFPDADGPPGVIASAVAALEHGANQYAPGLGVPALRQAIARHQQRHYGIELDPDREVVVTTGCTEGIAASLLGLIDPGDEVVVLEPYYDSYLAMIEMCGGVRRPVTLRAPDFRLDVDALRSAVGPRTKAILLNTPHNPTGTVLTRAELQAVADLAIERDLIVITDEVYEHLVFDEHEHVPLATLPGMWERTLTLSSAGKSYSFTGWKVGWATGPHDLVVRGALRQAVADVHVGLSVAAGRRARARRGAGLPGRARPLAAGPSRPARRRSRRRGAEGPPARGDVLRDDRHQPPRLGGREVLLPRAARAWPASWRSPTRRSTTTRKPAGTSCGGRSARSPTSSPRAYADWPRPT